MFQMGTGLEENIQIYEYGGNGKCKKPLAQIWEILPVHFTDGEQRPR